MSSQTLTFPCPFCGRKIAVGIELLGKRVRCPLCKQELVAPSAAVGSIPQKPATSSPTSPIPSDPHQANPGLAATPRQKTVAGPTPKQPSQAPGVPPSAGRSTPPKSASEQKSDSNRSEAQFKFPQKETADSIFSEPGESDDEVFSTPGGTKVPVPTLPDLPFVLPPLPEHLSPPPLPPQIPLQPQPIPVPISLPPPEVPQSANPFAFDADVPPEPVPVPIQPPRPFAPQPIPVTPRPWPATSAPIPGPSPASVNPVPAREPIEEIPEVETTAEPDKSVGLLAAILALSRKQRIIFFSVLGYAILMTLLAIYGLIIRSGGKLDPGHPLSTIPDSFGEFDPVTRKRVSQYRFPVDGELPAEQKTKLGGKIEIGQLTIEPTKIEIRPLKIITEGQKEKREEMPRDALVIHLRISNTSPEFSIYPMDPAFTRKSRSDDKPSTCLVIEKQEKQVFYGGAIEWPVAINIKRKYEEQQEKDWIPLKPGETREYEVFTDSDKQILKTVKESNDPMLWRIQVRRGLIEFKRREVPVTAIIGVEFKASDVKSSN
jgi:hypothetical protein